MCTWVKNKTEEVKEINTLTKVNKNYFLTIVLEDYCLQLYNNLIKVDHQIFYMLK